MDLSIYDYPSNMYLYFINPKIWDERTVSFTQQWISDVTEQIRPKILIKFIHEFQDLINFDELLDSLIEDKHDNARLIDLLLKHFKPKLTIDPYDFIRTASFNMKFPIIKSFSNHYLFDQRTLRFLNHIYSTNENDVVLLNTIFDHQLNTMSQEQKHDFFEYIKEDGMDIFHTTLYISMYVKNGYLISADEFTFLIQTSKYNHNLYQYIEQILIYQPQILDMLNSTYQLPIMIVNDINDKYLRHDDVLYQMFLDYGSFDTIEKVFLPDIHEKFRNFRREKQEFINRKYIQCSKEWFKCLVRFNLRTQKPIIIYQDNIENQSSDKPLNQFYYISKDDTNCKLSSKKLHVIYQSYLSDNEELAEILQQIITKFYPEPITSGQNYFHAINVLNGYYAGLFHGKVELEKNTYLGFYIVNGLDFLLGYGLSIHLPITEIHNIKLSDDEFIHYINSGKLLTEITKFEDKTKSSIPADSLTLNKQDYQYLAPKVNWEFILTTGPDVLPNYPPVLRRKGSLEMLSYLFLINYQDLNHALIDIDTIKYTYITGVLKDIFMNFFPINHGLMYEIFRKIELPEHFIQITTDEPFLQSEEMIIDSDILLIKILLCLQYSLPSNNGRSLYDFKALEEYEKILALRIKNQYHNQEYYIYVTNDITLINKSWRKDYPVKIIEK